MATKAHYPELVEQVELSRREFVFKHRTAIARGETNWSKVSKETGIPRSTLRSWEDRYLEIEVKEVVRMRDLADTGPCSR